MKLKNYTIAVILLGILFISGCGGQTTTTTEGYYGCFSGETSMIDAYFYEYAPFSSEASPYRPGEEIDVNVILENKMPEDLDAGKVMIRLKGDAAIESIFTGSSIVENPSLYSIDKDTCTVSDEEVELGPLLYEPELTTKITKEIAGTYCYEHPVEVHGYLFFTEDPTEVGVNLPSGANPPSGVQVTAIEQDPVDVSGDGQTATLRFKVYIQNVGTGTIVDTLDDCFAYRELGYRETLNVEVDTAYDEQDCTEEIRLSKDAQEDVITCEVTGIDPNNLGPQSSELTVTLNGFAYEDEITGVDIWLEP
ncbi:hypothetical protein HOD38_01680 [archaeon]|jgi:hypothetical protein|nr:hypothetical protein [archaeon]MBT4396955.1 hypothetical protein [archaeon]MBT4440946.1 hypothetical protein [archaeon]